MYISFAIPPPIPSFIHDCAVGAFITFDCAYGAFITLGANATPGRNINVSFTNNSNVPIEIMVFIFYSDEIAIDVKTGLVTRHKN